MRVIRPSPRAEIASAAFSEREHTRALPVFSPRGFAYRPLAGDNLLLLEAGGGAVCAGVLSGADGLAPGEIRIDSAGGACIRLCNNGDVVLNGVVITKAGEILPAGKHAKEGSEVLGHETTERRPRP